MRTDDTPHDPAEPDALAAPDAQPSGRPIVLALAALLVLTIGSWGLAHIDLGAAATPVAIAIAATKAAVVAVVFMEVMHASLPARVIGLVTISFIALLCAGTATDVLLR